MNGILDGILDTMNNGIFDIITCDGIFSHAQPSVSQLLPGDDSRLHSCLHSPGGVILRRCVQLSILRTPLPQCVITSFLNHHRYEGTTHYEL